MTKILLQEFVIDPICTIGNIPPVADAPDAGYAIFIDGDLNNTDESNIINFNHFQNDYTYADYLENFEMLDRLYETCLSLQEKLQQAHELIAKLQQTSNHQ